MRYERPLPYLSRALKVLSLAFLADGVAFTFYGPWALSLGPVRITGSTAAKPFTNGVLLLVAGFLTSRTLRVLVAQYNAAAFYLTAAIVTWALSWGPSPQFRDADVLAYGPYRLLQ